MNILHTHVTPTSKVLLPTEQLRVGDVLRITMMHPTPGLIEQLRADAIHQNKTLAIVDTTPHQVVVVCLRSNTQVWNSALINRKAHYQLLNNGRGTFGLEFMKPGQKLEVVSFERHPYFACKPINLPSLRVRASQTARKTERKYTVTKTANGAQIHRTQ